VKREGLFVLAGLVTASCALNPAPQPGSSRQAVINETSVRSHMEFLASNALNGRGSGTRDEWIAAAYLGATMRQFGLDPLGDANAFVQQVEIERAEAASTPTMSFGGRRFTHGKEILVQSLGGSRVEGRLVTFKEGVPISPGVFLLMPEGAAPSTATVGASAVLTTETAQARAKWAAAAGRMPTMARMVGVQSTSRVILDKGAYAALSALPGGTTVTIEADLKPALKTHTWNAVGRLPGSDPASASEVILLSAHIDHLGSRPPRADGADTIFNGADDDASGTVAVLELARAIALGPRPKRTIVFAFFGSEETGGLGSRFFADRPVVPLGQIVANLQFEMIGRPDAGVPPHTLWLTGYERSNLGPMLAKQGAKLVQDPHPEQKFFERSDNIQFARRGVVAHTVSSYGLHKEYHQPSDEVRLIDFAHMTDAIQSMLEPIRWLANSTFKPAWLPGMKP
jgi:aminopeptidase YwaD